MEDKRKYSRLNWSIDVRWKKSHSVSDACLPAGGNGASPGAGKTKDISAGGIRLILRGEGVAVGDVLELEIELGGGRNIRTQGRVAWIEKFKIGGWQDEIGYEGGVEFLNMDDATRQEISRFMMQARKGAA